jgi:D-3-phosphoglycerate dehydrogenase
MRSGVWQRIMGERLANQVIGIVGTGRIGKRVLKLLHGFHPKSVLVNDLKPDTDFYRLYNAESVDKETLFRESDLITFHIPLTAKTRHLVRLQQMQMMKSHCLLINTSRGGIINEHDLFQAIASQTIGGAAVDVFEEEPYSGRLIELDNCLISCHSGSMTRDCRRAMEILATEEAVRYIRNERLLNEVPEEEYINARGDQ